MMNSPLPPTPGPMPSLSSHGGLAAPAPQAANPQSLQDLMADGFYLLLLLKPRVMSIPEQAVMGSVALHVADDGHLQFGAGGQGRLAGFGREHHRAVRGGDPQRGAEAGTGADHADRTARCGHVNRGTVV